jgi:hypothetical protein
MPAPGQVNDRLNGNGNGNIDDDSDTESGPSDEGMFRRGKRKHGGHDLESIFERPDPEKKAMTIAEYRKLQDKAERA